MFKKKEWLILASVSIPKKWEYKKVKQISFWCRRQTGMMAGVIGVENLFQMENLVARVKYVR